MKVEKGQIEITGEAEGQLWVGGWNTSPTDVGVRKEEMARKGKVSLRFKECHLRRDDGGGREVKGRPVRQWEGSTVT